MTVTPRVAPLSAAASEELRRIVGDAHVITDPDRTRSFTVDWTRRYAGATPAVVRPGSVQEVAAVLAWCDAHGVAVVPQGGNTGLVGGSVPLDGEIVVSLCRLDRISDVDARAAQLTAGAGATCAAVHDAAGTIGLAFGVDLAARDSATIGGMVATNAGGLHVVRHGHLRHQVRGIEAVLADGSVLSHLGGLTKDNTGYDLGSLLCGSEGTLAVVTAVRVALVPRYQSVVVALVPVADAAEAVSLVSMLRASLESLHAAELMLADGLALVSAHLGIPVPCAGAAVLVECADHRDPSDDLAAALDGRPALVGVDSAGRGRLWRYREAHTEAISTLGVPHKLDVTLPLGRLAEFVDGVPDLVRSRYPLARVVQFGHVGDGNIHVNVIGPDPDDEEVDALVLTFAAEHGGSISAEHGIGTAKKQWLHLNRTPAELAAFRAIKRALDPHGTLNPNVLFG